MTVEINRLITEFQVESNRIEGIHGARSTEVEATRLFVEGPPPTVAAVQSLAFVYQGDKATLRNVPGLDVRVGSHVPPRGGPHIYERLRALLDTIEGADPYNFHVAYETLHPLMDGNGRSGRALWAWQMVRLKHRNETKLHEPHAMDWRDYRVQGAFLDWQALSLGFLHRFYYQALQGARQ